MNKINEKLNIFNDGIGFVEQYDFSTANTIKIRGYVSY